MIEIPLTPAQERMWFLDRFDPGQPNNVVLSRRLRGHLDPAALQRAFTAVCARHEALRATFPERDGRPVQVIADPGEFRLERADLTGEPAPLRAERARELGRQLFDGGFDLARGPLIRATLVALADDDHVLLVVAHHIVFDGSSQSLLVQDLGPAYADPASLGPLPVGWADHVREQADQPAEKAEEALAYWRDKLAGAPALALPTDLPRPPFKLPRSERVRHELDAELTGRLERLARAQRSTLFMLLLAAYQVLLGRHAGQDDVSVGTASAGRGRPELEPIIGSFVNTLVLRGSLSGDPTFAELLRRTRTAALEAYAHQDIPFERLVGELDVARDVSRTPLFSTMLVLHSQQSARHDVLPGLTGESFEIGAPQSLYDLVVDVSVRTAGLTLRVRYDSGLFTAGTVSELLRRFETLLRAVAADPHCPIDDLPLEDAAARRLAVTRGIGPRRTYTGTVLDLFAARVAAAPDALAVDDVTYAELDRRARRIAANLDVRPGDIVGVALPRTPDLVATLLAIWHRGAAYLPLDAALPPARREWLCADAGVVTVIDDLATLPGPAGNVAGEARPESLAYVLYTSGSTGRPKGVGVPHRALTNLLLSLRDALGSGAGDAWLGLTSLSFDISGLELYLPLVTGGRLVLVPDDEGRDGVAIVRRIAATGVTHVQATPSGWRMLLDAGFNAPAVTALTGGEALPPRLARELRPRVRRLCNVYGPTETTIWSSLADLPEPVRDIALGEAIGNTRLHVVDARLRPVPVGVPGELVIGGDGVAWGYLGRPGLTADRFVPDPYGPPGARVYRTGDRVRWRPDRRLEFLGRFDAQVKLRGHRIELGEIEARLGEHPDVHQAAVITTSDGPDALLAAYVTAKPGREPQGRALRTHLAEVLPGYMVPAQVVVLPGLPLNTAGKVDRRRLPAISAGDLDPREYVEPRTEAEEVIAGVWAEVLGRDRIGALDDFFDIGGHSLLATRVVSRLAAALELDVPIRILFLHSTVERFATAVEDLIAADLFVGDVEASA
ncbi:amino acid adenylation domain-containing protein [Dactylosporangium sp. NPDC051541]|uniref:amino acid adenylation domain-containing protein n=1 Tax=Dactylosporangium sp. NPDC051541 TaxID=3363977 RepID=UPI00378F67F9